ncbi:phospholipid-binding lipoprotein MlaA [Cricetibacter osteomyelitidis]|uniref:Phospholipid-binding lipoprotein MlaA n=1 Tax=Cricetibacter osteomyelitidis TaxID=1521931 RepID=A0A4R2T5A8_9PAST|nr:VacJ family lipoprotein [Cricetibacter osteomyelitidis]TCP97245.1 phospholipid-binding lipoprotein MlaA [Cricetibacter osteomyelitidis]
MKKNKLILTALLTAGVLTGCATTDPETGVRNDPLEGFNRSMWNFNYNYLDPYLLKPVAKGWKNYVPSPVTAGLVNVANNLDEPVSFVNRLIEGEGKKAMVHFNRFWINSVFGLGGLIDWASYDDRLKIDGERTFGDTLASYGVEQGAYIMLPAYGATTPTQLTGSVVDMAYTYPFWDWVGGPWSLVKYGVQAVDSRAKAMDKEALLEQAQDPYITFREAYFQNLDFRATDGKGQEVKETLSQEELNSID